MSGEELKKSNDQLLASHKAVFEIAVEMLFILERSQQTNQPVYVSRHWVRWTQILGKAEEFWPENDVVKSLHENSKA